MRSLTKKEADLYFLYFKCVSLLKYNYENELLRIKHEIEEKSKSGASVEYIEVIAAMSAITGVIDALARTLKVSRKLSSLNQKGVEFKFYISSQDWVIDARNKVQHINDEIKNNNTGLILGSLIWANGTSHYLLSLNSPFPGEQIPGLVIDTHTGKTLMELAYVYNERYLDIPRAFDGAMEFSKYVKSGFVAKDENGNIQELADNHIFAKMDISLSGQIS